MFWILLLGILNILTYMIAYINNDKCEVPYPFESFLASIGWMVMGVGLFIPWLMLTVDFPEFNNPLNKFLDRFKEK